MVPETESGLLNDKVNEKKKVPLCPQVGRGGTGRWVWVVSEYSLEVIRDNQIMNKSTTGS